VSAQLLVVDRVRHRFASGGGLRGVSLSVAPGEVVALVGANGSGKTTLLRLIAGLLPLEQGTISIDGRPAAAGRADIGIAFQDARLLPWRSAARNVSLPLELAGAAVGPARAAAVAALERVAARHLADRPPATLSGGERQRVALARALVRGPRLVLLDEPFAALDAPTRARLDAELPHLVGGAAALLVTHDVGEALRVADRVLVLGAAGSIAGEWRGLRREAAEARAARHSTPEGAALLAAVYAALESERIGTDSAVGAEAVRADA